MVKCSKVCCPEFEPIELVLDGERRYLLSKPLIGMFHIEH